MLATKVIATGITHLTDARYFAAWEVDTVAFQLGEGGIDWLSLNAMREWIEGPTISVELGAAAGAMAGELAGNSIQHCVLPYTAPAAAQVEVVEGGASLTLIVPVAGYQSAEDLQEILEESDQATSFILDFENGGITWQDLHDGHPFSLENLKGLLAGREVYLQIALGETDPKVVAQDYSIAGFAVRGSSEEKVGYKSFDDIDPLFEGLEVFE